ncbi:MAG: hypothetical protein DMG96_01730 [Acidobacteria bacterium]|nr:MAG: hypothetical protein DMG96_01730 [Acidobacteriota bacterium]
MLKFAGFQGYNFWLISGYSLSRDKFAQAYTRNKQENTVKKLAIIMVLLSTFAWAGAEANPSNYAIDVHVTSCSQRSGQVRLKVTIDGKKYELQGGGWLLIPGDYKARVVKDAHNNEYEVNYRMYELLLPDKKTKKYWVTGIME